ncbi:protein turtle homolog B-like isoform X1 [Montipora foliosa]|uniref:protein turtle homolog B-like isoform X1 n=1 Tax=Montipora foliosa TaxID=591990 RepID=UPI0035F12FBE
MSSMYFIFAALLFICGLRYKIECAPWFTLKPNNGNDYYVLNGTNTLSLIWDYNSDGESVREVSLLYFDESTRSDVYVAAKFGSSALIVYNSYTGRVQFFARATFTIDKIIPSDSREFKCLVNFNMPPVTPGIQPGMSSAVRVVVVVPPSITLKSSAPFELNEGETRTLLCVATGNPKPSYKWEKDGAVLQQGTTSNYTISSAKKEDRGRYKCTAEVVAPGLATDSASYSVDVKVKFAPQVTRLSSNQTLNDGNDATFSCTAEAYPMPITYNWFKNVTKIRSSAEFVINDFVSESRLTVRQISKSSADRYSCSGTNSVGEGQKKSVFLNVRYAPQAVTMTASKPEVKEGQSVTLTCQSDGFPSPSFSWRFNGNTINGALNNEFLVANAEVKDAGNYTCIATNIRGSKQFTRVVNVRYKPTQTNFTTGNVRNTAVQGTTVTLTCSANGFPAPTYVIKRNGTQVMQSGGKHVIMNIQLNAEHDTYACEPTNDEGPGPIKTFQITVEIPPRFPATSLSSLNKTENETYTFSCTAEAKPAATILWMLNNQNITRVPPYSINTSVIPIQNSKLKKTLSYLTITRITWMQKGLYSCIAYNSAGQQRQSAVLGVRYRPVVQFPEDHPKNHTVAVGETVTFYCKTIGNPPTKRHKWQFNGVDIPGESCDNGCPFIRYTKNGVVQQDAGRYSCIGYNDLGYGPPATAELFVKHPPKIKELPQTSYTVNETHSVTMVCWTEGVPKPKVTWKKSSNDQIVGDGEMFTIVNTTGLDDGKYTCTATNELGTDSKEVTLNVQTRPVITTSTPMATNVPGEVGEEVKLSCIAAAKPSPQMSWKRELNGDDLRTMGDQKITGIYHRQNSIEMTVVTSALNERFYCIAVNFLGRDTQRYRIRERGAPDAPQDVKLVSFQVPDAKTVSVNVSWTPGYDGGFSQVFTIHYKRKGAGDFTEESVGNPPNNMHTVQQLRPETEYQFMVLATNERGKSETSALTLVRTKVSAVPPDRGTVRATRSSDDSSVIILTWTVTDEKVRSLVIEMTEGSFRPKRELPVWKQVPGSSGITLVNTEFKVEDLNADKAYTFRVGMTRDGEDLDSCLEACYVYSDPVSSAPLPSPSEDDEILQDWVIAIIAGVAGFLLLCIVILYLLCFIRRKKSHGADRVNMSQTSSYAVGGPEVSRSLDPRPRSFGLESVEDDPFIEAHFASMQSMTAPDGKKKKPDNSVNYGYLSQDSVQNQPEMLLNPGSRLGRNHPIAQSTGNLDNSAYPARGPQRDFNTLPPYYEPPSFEEAMRQSGRKQKTRKSTGDLVGPGQGRSRRPRQSTTDEPTDSSDGETRWIPQRAAPPPPRMRHVESSRPDPGYTSVDLGRGSGVLPHGPRATSAPRNNGPLDPSALYAEPHKKRSKRSRGELSEPTVEQHLPPPRMYGPPYWRESLKGWPPPQYTPEERPPEDPMLDSDLDLDDPSNLPTSERPPDHPIPMALLPSSRSRPSYHDDMNDGLPEPPAFLRDVVYPPGGREPRYDDSDDAAPYQPPSPAPAPAWQRQPYVNINGQLHRAPSRDYSDFQRPNPIRSSRDSLTPEPEMPPRQWEPRRPEPDNRSAPEMNYVSYLV